MAQKAAQTDISGWLPMTAKSVFQKNRCRENIEKFDLTLSTMLAKLNMLGFQSDSDFSQHATLSLGFHEAGSVSAGHTNIKYVIYHDQGTSSDHMVLIGVGSQQRGDWLENMLRFKVRPKKGDNEERNVLGKVHYGFYRQATRALPAIQTLLHSKGFLLRTQRAASNPQEKNLYFTGYSLGGPVIKLVKAHLSGQIPYKSTVYTYDSPRTGDSKYASYFNICISEGVSYRVVHRPLGVPGWANLVPYVGYRHDSRAVSMTLVEAREWFILARQKKMSRAKEMWIIAKICWLASSLRHHDISMIVNTHESLMIKRIKANSSYSVVENPTEHYWV